MRHRKTELQDFMTTTRWRSQQASAVRVNDEAEIIYIVCLLKKVIGYLSHGLPHLWRNNAPITHPCYNMHYTHTHKYSLLGSIPQNTWPLYGNRRLCCHSTFCEAPIKRTLLNPTSPVPAQRIHCAIAF
jgi:hypothetical protein